MENVDINYVSVILAAVSSMVLGFVWYSPALFGKPWMALMGFKEKDMGKMQEEAKKGYAVSFVLSIVTAYVIAHFVKLIGVVTIEQAVQLGFWTWLGFVGTTQLGDQLWGGQPMKLFYINSGYRLVSLIIMVLILTMWV